MRELGMHTLIMREGERIRSYLSDIFALYNY